MTEYRDPGFPALFRQLPIEQNEASIKLFFDILQDLIQALGEWDENIKSILRSGISREDNLDQVDVSFTSNASPDTEDGVAHTLGKVPVGFRVITKDKAGDVYGTPALGTAWSKTTIYLKTSVASVALKIEVF